MMLTRPKAIRHKGIFIGFSVPKGAVSAGRATSFVEQADWVNLNRPFCVL